MKYFLTLTDFLSKGRVGNRTILDPLIRGIIVSEFFGGVLGFSRRGGCAELFYCLRDGLNTTDTAECEPDDKISEISTRNLRLCQEKRSGLGRLKEGQRKVNLALGIPFLINGVDVHGKASVPCDQDDDDGHDNGDDDTFQAFFFAEEGVSADGTDYSDDTADRSKHTELIKQEPNDTAYQRKQERADRSGEYVFLNGFVDMQISIHNKIPFL